MRNKSASTLLLALSLVTCLTSHAASPDAEYATEAEIPEPMVFDLVRRLDSQKGEFEVNSLFHFDGAREASGLKFAPEFEYAFANGFAGELELPVANGKLESLKLALQSKIGEIRYGHLEKGVQAIYQQHLSTADKEVSLLAINGLRFAPRFSILTLIGGLARTEGARTHWGVLVNGTLFYNNSREVDVAFETNFRDGAGEPSELKLIPQVHLLFARDVKIQMGIGAMLEGAEWLTFSAVRTVWESN